MWADGVLDRRTITPALPEPVGRDVSGVVGGNVPVARRRGGHERGK